MDPYGGPGASRPGALDRVGGSGRPRHNARDRGAGSVPAQNPWLGQAGQGKALARTLAAAAAGARRGSLPRSGLGSLCKMGRTSARRLTLELRAAAPLPPLPPRLARGSLSPARQPLPPPLLSSPLPTPTGAAARAGAEPSRGSAAQRPSARRRGPVRKGRGQPTPRPRPGHGQGAGTPQIPSFDPASRAAGANGRAGKERRSAERVL